MMHALAARDLRAAWVALDGVKVVPHLAAHLLGSLGEPVCIAVIV